ncbi:MAG: type II secretion system F family protein, partial [Thermoplasmata archaeon]
MGLGEDYIRAYKELRTMPRIGMSPMNYIIGIVIIPTLIAILLATTAMLVFPEIFEDNIVKLIVVAVLIFIPVMLNLFPVVIYQKRGHDIDQDMHLFITRMGVLSQSDVSRKGMFNLLQHMKEYRALAVEVQKIYMLADKWHISLEKACRTVAELTPSRVFGDFLLRLAHAVETGEPVEAFFKNEQIVVMNQYSANYESALRSVSVLQDAFISTITALCFIIVFAELIPMLVGIDATLEMGLVIVMFVMTESIFLYLIYGMVPGEHIWHTMDIETETDKKIKLTTIISGLGCIAVGVFAFLTPDLPIQFAIALTFTPLILPGLYINWEEEQITRRDENYPSFIRSLGISAETKGRDISYALKGLRIHDFGPLTKNINDLYKRTAMRINRIKSWHYFGAETGSELISKFSEMYVEGTGTGGNPKQIAQIISDNFIKIIALRMHRFKTSANLTGILYGLCVAIVFVLFMTLQVVNNFYNLFQAIDFKSTELTFLKYNSLYLGQGGFDLNLMTFLLLFICSF